MAFSILSPSSTTPLSRTHAPFPHPTPPHLGGGNQSKQHSSLGMKISQGAWRAPLLHPPKPKYCPGLSPTLPNTPGPVSSAVHASLCAEGEPDRKLYCSFHLCFAGSEVLPAIPARALGEPSFGLFAPPGLPGSHFSH